MYAKYKAMRDTAIDIGKWINTGVGKTQSNGSQTKYDTPFLEQRAIRNQKIIKDSMASR
jgi:hypothetical protein